MSFNFDPGSIDHTTLDIRLVGSTDLPVGRPTMHVMIDAYSRRVVGMDLNFGSDSETPDDGPSNTDD